MWTDWMKALRRAMRSRYVLLLEEEVERLRAENRALLNSLLGTAGFPPIEPPADRKPVALPAMRRRSWPQIALERERACGAAGRAAAPAAEKL